MSELKRVLMERDEIDSKEADEWIEEAKKRFRMGENPNTVLEEELGLEPGYLSDLLD
jgi:hypothetical protein